MPLGDIFRILLPLETYMLPWASTARPSIGPLNPAATTGPPSPAFVVPPDPATVEMTPEGVTMRTLKFGGFCFSDVRCIGVCPNLRNVSSPAWRSVSTNQIPSATRIRYTATWLEYTEAIKGAIEREAASLAAELKSGATISEDVAGRWLRDHGLTNLTGDFSEASLHQFRNALADAWAAGGSFNQLVNAIHSVLADFSDEQAAIAQTVGNTAHNVGRIALPHVCAMAL